MIAPGEYLVVANDAAALLEKHAAARIAGEFSRRLSNKSDWIVLFDQHGNPADEVHYYDGGRWPSAADGGGSSLELRNPNSNNSRAEAWAASDESTRSRWNTYAYRGVAETFVSGSPTEKREFALGLLDGAGELLLDDVSVVDITAGGSNMLQNASFEGGTIGWRLEGNHRHSRSIPDPDDPSRRVLHLVATGPSEYMGNQIESRRDGFGRDQ